MWGLSAAGGQALRAAGYYFFDSLSALHLSQQALVVLIEGGKMSLIPSGPGLVLAAEVEEHRVVHHPVHVPLPLAQQQVAVKPPTFVVFVNDKELMHFSYQRYLENKIRESFGFKGTSLKFFVRERKERDN